MLTLHVEAKTPEELIKEANRQIAILQGFLPGGEVKKVGTTNKNRGKYRHWTDEETADFITKWPTWSVTSLSRHFRRDANAIHSYAFNLRKKHGIKLPLKRSRQEKPVQSTFLP